MSRTESPSQRHYRTSQSAPSWDNNNAHERDKTRDRRARGVGSRRVGPTQRGQGRGSWESGVTVWTAGMIPCEKGQRGKTRDNSVGKGQQTEKENTESNLQKTH